RGAARGRGSRAARSALRRRAGARGPHDPGPRCAAADRSARRGRASRPRSAAGDRGGAGARARARVRADPSQHLSGRFGAAGVPPQGAAMSDITALFPGTFDPFTNGHLDLTRRAARLFDRVVVAVARSTAKGTLFSAEERVEMIVTATKSVRRIEVVSFED